MLTLSPHPTWTMNVALNRKRSRLALESDDEDRSQDHGRYASPETDRTISSPPPNDTLLKKTRTQGELDELDIIDAQQAWVVDTRSILESPTLERPEGSSLQPHNNVPRYLKESSIIILCVQGNVHLHYDLLCGVLPDLYNLSPSLQALVLCRDPSTHVLSNSPSTSYSLPLIQAVGSGYNHFVRLGLLHPLGAGQFPLDAIVVLDSRGRRRLVLPFGWGAGRHAGSAGGKLVRDTMTDLLLRCVGTLYKET